MSLIGCIGKLMCNSGIEELFSTAFKGVPHMMNGKAWPKAFRGLRMVVEAVLKPFVLAGSVTVGSLQQLFDDTRQLRTARLWIDFLIIPVSILFLCFCAEREGDWLLHIYSLHRMVPYFFAAGHSNYARYIKWHIIDMSPSQRHTADLSQR